LPTLAELPPSLRAGLPRLAVSGAVYSPDPSARMLLVNGQVVREGESVAPGLVLERIAPRQAVFSWQGTRFQMKV
jgi:general secretion pathway protein B